MNDILWKVTQLSNNNIIYIVAPRWFEARSIAQSVLMAEREDIRILRLHKIDFTPQELANRGEEVYVCQFGKETLIKGGLRIFPENH